MRYTLRRVSASVYEITTERRKAGFVRATADGYLARIGDHTASAATAAKAFDLVSAKAFGFETPADLAAHNATARRKKAAFRTACVNALNAAVGDCK